MFDLLHLDIASSLLASLSSLNSTKTALPFLFMGVPALMVLIGVTSESQTRKSQKHE